MPAIGFGLAALGVFVARDLTPVYPDLEGLTVALTLTALLGGLALGVGGLFLLSRVQRLLRAGRH